MPSMFHMEANCTISSAHAALFTIMNWPPRSISAERQFSEEAMKKSSSVWPSYFGWSLTKTPRILELF